MHLIPSLQLPFFILILIISLVTFYLIRSFLFFFGYHSVYEFHVFEIFFLDAFLFIPFSIPLSLYPFIPPSSSLHHSLPLLIFSLPLFSLLPSLPPSLPIYLSPCLPFSLSPSLPLSFSYSLPLSLNIYQH